MKDPSNFHRKGAVRGVARLWRALIASLHGLRSAFQNEEAFRLEVAAAVLLIPVALLLSFSPLEKVALIGVVFGVLITELLNSGIEATVDLVSEDYHPLAKKAKDIASAAVFLSLVFAVAVWSVLIVLHFDLIDACLASSVAGT